MVLVEEMVEKSEAMEFVVWIGVVQFAQRLQLAQTGFVHQFVITDNLERREIRV